MAVRHAGQMDVGAHPTGMNDENEALNSRNEIVHLVWDLTLERPTLGGALTLRQEAEMLAQLRETHAVAVHWASRPDDEPVVRNLAEKVFASSAIEFSLHEGLASVPEDAWPLAAERRAHGFSYYSYNRVIALHARHRLRPRLQWSSPLLAAAEKRRVRIDGRLVCAHLKRVPPHQVEESNAELSEWQKFLSRVAKPGERSFLLLGSDELPADLLAIPGLISAQHSGISLSEQLAIVSLADGFLAMGSGICAAANFSGTPHVIFKHPAHHSAEMDAELAGRDSFSFAGERQWMWRRRATADALDSALNAILK